MHECSSWLIVLGKFRGGLYYSRRWSYEYSYAFFGLRMPVQTAVHYWSTSTTGVEATVKLAALRAAT
eukprot:scaffold123442_cov36-Prasinocladus_malaysianus.AAC.2